MSDSNVKSHFEGMNYYDVLGVKKDASKEEIKRAYFKLSKIYHPDLNKEPSAPNDFKILSEAYQTLYDEESRKKYDNFSESFNETDINNKSNKSSAYKSKYVDVTFMDFYFYSDNKDDVYEMKFQLNKLDNNKLMFAYEYFWITLWSGTQLSAHMLKNKKASLIFSIFNELITSKKIDLNSINTNNHEDMYKKRVVYIISEIEKNKKDKINIFKFMSKLILDKNIFDDSSTCILGMKNYDITFKLFTLFEQYFIDDENYIMNVYERASINKRNKRLYLLIGLGVILIIGLVIIMLC